MASPSTRARRRSPLSACASFRRPETASGCWQAEEPGAGDAANKVRKIWVVTAVGCPEQADGCGVSACRGARLGPERRIQTTPPSTDSCVDFEPSDNTAPTDVVIDSQPHRARDARPGGVDLGIDGPDLTRRVQVHLQHPARGLDLRHRRGSADGPPATSCWSPTTRTLPAAASPACSARRRARRRSTANLLVTEDGGTDGVMSVSEVNQRRVSGAIIGHNLCFARSGGGIRSPRRATTWPSRRTWSWPTGWCTEGSCAVRAVGRGQRVRPQQNDITVQDPGSWVTGIRVIAREPVRQLTVLGNSIRGAGEGVSFQGAGFQQTPVCALNHVGPDVASPLVGLTVPPERSVVAGRRHRPRRRESRLGTGRSLVGSGDRRNDRRERRGHLPAR